MKMTDLYERQQLKLKNTNPGDGVSKEPGEVRIKAKRGARLTMIHLLKLRKIRERKKLQQIKDQELYSVMYGPGEDDSGGDMGF